VLILGHGGGAGQGEGDDDDGSGEAGGGPAPPGGGDGLRRQHLAQAATDAGGVQEALEAALSGVGRRDLVEAGGHLRGRAEEGL
jgi:hypothetical protein